MKEIERERKFGVGEGRRPDRVVCDWKRKGAAVDKETTGGQTGKKILDGF